MFYTIAEAGHLHVEPFELSVDVKVVYEPSDLLFIDADNLSHFGETVTKKWDGLKTRPF